MGKVPVRCKPELCCIVAAIGKPPHFSNEFKSAALCREAATPLLLADLGGF